MKLEAMVTEDHIHHAKWASWHSPDDDRRDAIETAIRDAGVDDVKIEIHLNLLPPNHDWGIWIHGKRYAMTHAMRFYYDDFRIHAGDRTDNALITFDSDTMTCDVQVLAPDNRPEWIKRGMTPKQYHEQVILGGKKPKPVTPLWKQKDSFPDWLSGRDMSQWTQEQIDAHFGKSAE